MGLFDIFKKKDKPMQDIPYRFNFDKAPDLLEVYKAYRSLKLEAVALSRKNSSNAKYENACAKRDNYAQNVLAKLAWDIFNPLAPTLHNADKDEYVDWNKLFDKTFEELSTEQKKYLVGLIEGDYIYELPNKYYND